MIMRKLLLEDDDETPLKTTLSPSITNYSSDPLLPPLNATSSTFAAATGSHEFSQKTFQPVTSPFDSSMALTLLVLLTALFFMAFFSVYIRRSSNESADIRRRRHHHNQRRSSPTTSSLSSLRFNSSKRGLDPSTVGSLPLIAYRAHATHPIDCAICLTEFNEKETVKMIPCCQHMFHPGCIDAWLASHLSCPLCRSTKMCVTEGFCLGVMQEDTDQGVTEDLVRGSTVDENDTWRNVGPLGIRRTFSCSSLRGRVELQRSRSF